MFYVVISEKGGSQKRLEFDKKEITIGRVQGNDIIFPKGNVSKRHSRIVLKDGKFIIVDLKSTNGTFVNGRKITSPQMIKSSDRIYIGDFTLSVEEFEGESGNIGGEDIPQAPTPLANNPPPAQPPPPLPPPKQPSVAATPVIPRVPVGAATPPPEPRVPMSSPTPPPSIKPVVVSSNGAALSSSGKLGNGAVISSKSLAPAVVSRTTPQPAESVRPASAKAAPIVVAAPPRRKALVTPQPMEGDPRAEYLRAKGLILEKLAEQIDTTSTAKPSPALIDSTKKKIAELLRANKSSAVTNSAQFTDEVCEEALGVGPLKDLLQDKQITEILVNGPYQITTVTADGSQPQTAAFGGELGLLCAIARLLAASGSTLPAEPTTVDITLRDGAHLLAMFPPYSPRGTTLILRKGQAPQTNLSALIDDGTLPENIAAFLEVCVRARISIFISGANESGRSLLLQALSSSFAPDERVGVLSDGGSLSLQNPQSFVLHQSLCQRALALGATRLLVQNLTLEHTGELVKALSSLTDGALVSGSGQNTQEAFERICAHAHMAFPMALPEAIRELSGKAFLLMLHTMRFSDGSKRVVQISEVCQVADADGNATYAPSDLFVWDGERLASTKQVPQFWPLLEARGEASGSAFFE